MLEGCTAGTQRMKIWMMLEVFLSWETHPAEGPCAVRSHENRRPSSQFMSDTTQCTAYFVTRDWEQSARQQAALRPPPGRTLTMHRVLPLPFSDASSAAPGVFADHRVVSQKLSDHLAGPTISSWGWVELAWGSPVNQNLLQQKLGSPAFNSDQ